jgi:hypothetical protein
VEDAGLFRSDMNDPTAPSVFPKLHELRDNGVASKLMRACDPQEFASGYARRIKKAVAVHNDI